jgi:formiminoglutamase
MLEPVDMRLWNGRVDEGSATKSCRWHQQVAPLGEISQAAGIVLLGVACDEGVRRNQGRVGAAAGPDAIRRALASQAWHSQRKLYDAGNLRCKNNDLEALQQEQAKLVKKLLDKGHFPLLLGGGHEIAYGSFLGLAQHLAASGGAGPIGIINFDAHFDLRQAAVPTSGTPFLQIAEYCQAGGIPFHYCCLGISEPANSAALFAQATQLDVSYLLDSELNSRQYSPIEQQLRAFITPCQAVYLSIDLDVLPAATAPGVSAPAAHGVALPELEHLLAVIRSLAQERLRVADIAEYNPEYDIDSRTAQVAARLCHQLIREWRSQ